jgi:hypothetical protein
MMRTMRYVDVRWRSQHKQDPIHLVSELDQQGYEVHKLKFFSNGEVGFASAFASRGGTSLCEASVPSIEEINADP